ncbi:MULTISPECIES: type II secretion system minor pseudopilin GspK [Burkholderia]|uniref:Type II secretion system protein K n=1 Tax=Burkholderia cepacia TaxID=292 RepID=A0AA89CB43_BURCE|nr:MULTISPECIES: type II secretion system minor pseudopilin GspK [Burkholderia]AOI76211.1 general secretion pathway protein GspK [Burkholderia sp. NRF60-BP8]KGB92543.1 type II secretion system (T2SS), K family protein [Burkholderia cepacia]KVA06976.1 general secretion pathway protein GspK [Burkholderia sp. NRF60-BP8]KWE54680.1 general secretion pathway protein GspK [Burkholderia sp. MSMB2157WGS]
MHRYGTGRTAYAPRERGIAIVTVLLVVALAATLAASVLWRQQVATRDVENQRLATQTMWIERAAVEWARATLRAQSATSNVTFVGQTWSAPVADVQLSDLLPSDALAVNAELSRAWISGSVEDAQARFNLMNLVSRAAPGKPWQSNGEGVLAYRRLLGQLSLDPALAQPTADYMLRSLRDANGPGGWPLQLVSVDDLARIPGYDAHAIEALAPYVTILPDLTVVNANTATEPVLVAAIPTLSASQAKRLVDRRATAYFVSTGDIAEYLLPAQGGNPTLPDGSAVGVNSGYFIVHCRVHSARINARVDTLIARYGSGNFAWTSVIWVRRLTS